MVIIIMMIINQRGYKHKVIVDNPYNNRDIILKITKKQIGVYLWETLDNKNIYVVILLICIIV